MESKFTFPMSLLGLASNAAITMGGRWRKVPEWS
jgi:hypothetical protein